MKKIIILSLGILFLFAGAGQLSAQKCKFDIDKKDPFTGVATKGILLGIKSNSWSTGIEIGFNKTGDAYFVNIKLTYTGTMRESIPKNAPFMIKLSNGETITIYSQTEYLPELVGSLGSVFAVYVAQYDIDANSIQKIAELIPTFFRINLDNNKAYDLEIDSKDKKKITNAAICILQ